MNNTQIKTSIIEKTTSLKPIYRVLLLMISALSILSITQPALALKGGYKVYSRPDGVRMSNTNNRIYKLTGKQKNTKNRSSKLYYQVKYRHAGTWHYAWVSERALTRSEKKKHPIIALSNTKKRGAKETLALNPNFSVRSGPSTKHRKYGKIKDKNYYHTGVTSKNGKWMQLKCKGCKKPRWVSRDAATWTPYNDNKNDISTDKSSIEPQDLSAGDSSITGDDLNIGDDLSIGDNDHAFDQSTYGSNNNEVTDSESNETTDSEQQPQKETGKKKNYAAQFMCAARAVGIRSGKRLRRAKFFASTYQKFFHSMKTPPSDQFLRHLYAQQFQETNNLLWLEEQRSKYASSRKKHKGRGGIQLTHKRNYAQFATFYKKYRDSTSPLTRRQLLSGKKDYSSFEVKNPKSAFSETHKWGKERNALAGVFYFLRTSKERKIFRTALEVDSWTAVKLVGQGVNRGPSKIGIKRRAALHNATRYKKYTKIRKCFAKK